MNLDEQPNIACRIPLHNWSENDSSEQLQPLQTGETSRQSRARCHLLHPLPARAAACHAAAAAAAAAAADGDGVDDDAIAAGGRKYVHAQPTHGKLVENSE